MTTVVNHIDTHFPLDRVVLAPDPSHFAHLIEDPEQFTQRIKLRNKLVAEAGLVKVPIIEKLWPVVSLAQWQTPIRDQQDRGSCYAFAVCAAMEAAYRRQHNVTLDLSEQFAFHVNKAGELYPNFETDPRQHENNSSMWGFQGASDLAAKLIRTAIPGEADAPYLNGAQMTAVCSAIPAANGLKADVADDTLAQEILDAFEFAEGHIPLASRYNSQYRAESVSFLPGSPTTEQIQAVIASGHEVIADIPGHCVLIVGYDVGAGEWLIKNSWGGTDFVRAKFGSQFWGEIRGGAYITSVAAPAVQKDDWWVGNWNMDHDGWRGRLVIRRHTDYRIPVGTPTKLGDYYRFSDGTRHDVNGTVDQSGRRMHFWIADTTARVPAGMASGQEFTAYVFSWDPHNAAGVTTWQGIPFGVSLSRDNLAGKPTNGFKRQAWIADWAMNHDGWRGTLTISGVAPFTASYRAQNGVVLPVSGAFASDHELNLTIDFGGGNKQPFRLLAHTWESTRFSGTTVWGGMTFGVQGMKHGLLIGAGKVPFPHQLHP